MSDMPNPGAWAIFQGSGGGIPLGRIDEYGGQTTPIKLAQGSDDDKRLGRWLRDYDRALTKRMSDLYGVADQEGLRAVVPWAWPRVYSTRYAFLVAPSDRSLVPVAAVGIDGWRALTEEQAHELIRDPEASSVRPPGGFQGEQKGVMDTLAGYVGLEEGAALPSAVAPMTGLALGGGAIFFGWDMISAFFKRAWK